MCYSNICISACVVEFWLRLLENEKTKIYEGSWAEYGKVEEPNFNMGNLNRPMNEIVDEYFKMQGEESFHKD